MTSDHRLSEAYEDMTEIGQRLKLALEKSRDQDAVIGKQMDRIAELEAAEKETQKRVQYAWDACPYSGGHHGAGWVGCTRRDGCLCFSLIVALKGGKDE